MAEHLWATKEKTIFSVSKEKKLINYQNISAKVGRFQIKEHTMVLRWFKNVALDFKGSKKSLQEMVSQIRETCKNAKTLNMADFNYPDIGIDLDKNCFRAKETNVFEKVAKDLFSKQCADQFQCLRSEWILNKPGHWGQFSVGNESETESSEE